MPRAYGSLDLTSQFPKASGRTHVVNGCIHMKKVSSRSSTINCSERKSLVMAKERKDAYQCELDWFKANEIPECVLLVDNSLLRFLVAWKRVVLLRKRRLTGLPNCDKAGIWQWLWQNVDFSMDDFAALSGTSIRNATEKFKMLSGNGMVYPDGTLNTYVDRLLKARTVLLFQKSQPRAQRTEERGLKSVERQ